MYINIKTKVVYTRIDYLNNLDNIYEIDIANLTQFYKYNGFGEFKISDNKAIFFPDEINFNVYKQEKEKAKQEEENDKILKKQRLLPYKELNNSDYKIIKCMETFLSTLPKETINSIDFPYDVKSLIAERQSQRDIINNQETA